ncbi:MAG: hypothetical protein IT406_01145 [Candidatus Yanofskybacteria bacterium]|nr:hypothetical protein [Candidatus Yanofskybacteria bacterium]
MRKNLEIIELDVLVANYIRAEATRGSGSLGRMAQAASRDAKIIRETFQTIAFAPAIQELMGRKLFVTKPEQCEFPDYQILVDGEDTHYEVENLRIPNHLLANGGITNQVELSRWVFLKKPPNKIRPNTILAVYGDFTAQAFDLSVFAEEIAKLYSGHRADIWFYAKADPLEQRWVVHRVNPPPELSHFYYPFGR